ncbi:LPS biosynthesis-modulating metalloenzyme YejM [Orbus sasakiae]|uniref:LPS biosynthesis-modulating metalloenzyme YejM n=1 Tax=Orbus sasakiae TaxID=1078475 RepID=A0ABP9N313_9GAMM
MVKLKHNSLRDDRTSQIVSWGHWFALFNIFLVIILGSRYLFIADWPQTLLGRIYAIISCIGHFSFLTFVVYLILLFPLSFIIQSSKWQRIIAVIVATIAITTLLIDIEVFSRFRMHLNFSIWQVLTSPDDNILSAEWQKLFIFVPFILLLETVFAIWSWRKLRSLSKRSRFCLPIIIVFVLCFLSSHLIHIWADANFYRPITMQRSSLPVSYPLTARHFLERYGFIEAGNYESRFKQEGNPFAIAIEYPLAKINYERTKSPYNILMIVVDEWQTADQQKNMPKLTDYAQQNVEFVNHYSSSNESFLGEFSLFYGLDPNYYNSILASHKSSVFIDTLAKQRYNLGLFSSDGFDHPLYRYALLSNFSMPIVAKKQSYQATSDLWLTWYNEQKKTDNSAPWFSIIEYKQMQKEGTSKQQKDLDEAIARVIEQIKHSSDIDKTIVVITASNRQSKSDQHAFDRQLLNVPLVIGWPNKGHEVITSTTSHVDIMQTLMQDALNVTTSAKQYSQGENLFAPNNRKWLIAGTETDIAALYPSQTILIDSTGYYQIYDLNNQRQKNEKLGLSTFLQLVTENRRFMVAH